MNIEINSLIKGKVRDLATEIDKKDSNPNNGFVTSQDLATAISEGKITQEDCKAAGIQVPTTPEESVKLMENYKLELEALKQELKEVDERAGFKRDAKGALIAGGIAGGGTYLLSRESTKEIGYVGKMLAKLPRNPRTFLVGGIAAMIIGGWSHLQGDQAKDNIRKNIDSIQDKLEQARNDYNNDYFSDYPTKLI